jgi:hypothetical protein
LSISTQEFPHSFRQHSSTCTTPRAFAFAHRFLQGIAPESRYGWLQLGQEVAVTCSRLSLSSQSMIVQRLEYSNDGMVAFTLAWIEDPFRDG